jgi:glycosyltransferase involved in cell wall biosynthesis
MACGLAPIVADLPQYAGILERGVNASVFDGSLEGLCSALREVLADPTRRRALDRRSLAAAGTLSVEAIAERHLERWSTLA